MKIKIRKLDCFLVLMTYAMIFFIFTTIWTSYAHEVNEGGLCTWLLWLIYSFITFSAIANHAVCMVTSVKPQSQSLQGSSCLKCQNPKDQHVHHCSRCNTCIYKMDHHCFWVNNCVGLYNQKLYILFLIYIALFTSISAILIFLSKIICSFSPNLNFCYVQASWVLDLCKMISLIICFFFFAFVLFLLTEQYESLLTNLSQIDRLKNITVNQPVPFKISLEKIFGGRLSVMWILPIPARKLSD